MAGFWRLEVGLWKWGLVLRVKISLIIPDEQGKKPMLRNVYKCADDEELIHSS